MKEFFVNCCGKDQKAVVYDLKMLSGLFKSYPQNAIKELLLCLPKCSECAKTIYRVAIVDEQVNEIQRKEIKKKKLIENITPEYYLELYKREKYRVRTQRQNKRQRKLKDRRYYWYTDKNQVKQGKELLTQMLEGRSRYDDRELENIKKFEIKIA